MNSWSVITSVVFLGAFFLTVLMYCIGAGRDWNRNIITTMLLVLAIISLSACTSTPYLDAGIGWRINGNDHSHFQTGEVLNPKDEPVGVFSLGTEWDNKSSCEWMHISYIGRGRPFNNKDEASSDHVLCSVRFGGK